MTEFEKISRQITARAREAARMGDQAARVERLTPDRRSQRRLQTINKLARATETATEASGILLKLAYAGWAKRKVPPPVAAGLAHRFLIDTDVLTADLYFEVMVVGANQPQPRKSRPAPKKKG